MAETLALYTSLLNVLLVFSLMFVSFTKQLVIWTNAFINDEKAEYGKGFDLAGISLPVIAFASFVYFVVGASLAAIAGSITSEVIDGKRVMGELAYILVTIFNAFYLVGLAYLKTITIMRDRRRKVNDFRAMIHNKK